MVRLSPSFLPQSCRILSYNIVNTLSSLGAKCVHLYREAMAGKCAVICKLYGAPTRLLVLNYSVLLTYPQW